MDFNSDFEEIADIEVVPAISFEQIGENVSYSSKLGLKSIVDNPAWRVDNHIAIVGGGPSLKDYLDDLRRYKYIMACGSVHDYLIRNGIIPTWCIICDPDEIMVSYLREKNLVTEYLIASQCHSKVFEHLKHTKTYIWHAGGSEEENARIGFTADNYIIGGGCTVGTRAIVMALMFGFENQVLFGLDSCLTDDYQHHAYDFVNKEKESIGNIFELKLDNANSPTFKVAGYMLAQIRDFQAICSIYAKNIKFTVMGNGALAYIVKVSQNKAVTLLNEE